MSTTKSSTSVKEHSNAEWILGDDIYSILDLHPHECLDITLLISGSGWITAKNKKLPEIAYTKLYIKGFFPCHIQSFSTIKSPTNEYNSSYRYSHHEYKIAACLDSPFASVGITPEKAKLLNLDDGSSSLSDIFFTTDINYSASYMRPDFGFSSNIFISIPELINFGEKHGVFDVEDKIRVYNERLEKISAPEVDSTNLNSSVATERSFTLHTNTSKQLLDLIEANNEFWLLYDPNDPYTATTKERVVKWLIEKGYKKTLADKIDTILRDGRAQPGGRRPTL